MTNQSTFPVAVLVNRTTPGLSCWDNALAFVQAAHAAPETTVLGVFITGKAVNDLLHNVLDLEQQQAIRQLLAQGVPLRLCSSRAEAYSGKLPLGLSSASLGQWMEWAEEAQEVVEWA